MEAYLNHLYSAQLITLPVHTAFNSSRTKEYITTKRRRSFAFAFEYRQPLLGERIINTCSFSQKLGVRNHNYEHSLASSQ